MDQFSAAAGTVKLICVLNSSRTGTRTRAWQPCSHSPACLHGWPYHWGIYWLLLYFFFSLNFFKGLFGLCDMWINLSCWKCFFFSLCFSLVRLSFLRFYVFSLHGFVAQAEGLMILQFIKIKPFLPAQRHVSTQWHAQLTATV